MVGIIKKNLYNYLANSNDLKKIQSYIHNNWKKKHILSLNKKLFNWQHNSIKKKIDFLVKKKNNKIVAILGVINFSRDRNFSEVALAIWHTKKRVNGLNLFSKVLLDKNIKSIKATTISEEAIQLYKLIGFKVNSFNQYYITHLSSQKQQVSKGLIEEDLNMNIKCNLIFDKIKKILKRKKLDKKFLSWRYVNHPIYKYYFLTESNYRLILICRIIYIKDIKFLRVVDFIGSFKGKLKFSKKINIFLKKNNFHHIDFLHFGSEDKNIQLSGFKKINNNQILPLYTEPYTGLKKINMNLGYKLKNKKKKIKIVLADGDSDRPSMC